MNARLRAAILECAYEDLIPVPEVMQTVEQERLAGDEDPVTATRDELVALVREGVLRVYRGPWYENEPSRLDQPEAIEALSDPKWFHFRLSDPEEERLYFINVAVDAGSP